MKTKILKIIQIVYDILSLAFIAVVIASIAIAPKSEANRIDNVVIEVKSRDNLVINYGYGVASPFEIFSRNELYEGFSGSFTNASTIGFTYSMPYMTSDTYYIEWYNFDMNNPDNSVINHGVALTSAYFELKSIGSRDYNRYQGWDLVLVFGNSGRLIYSIEIMYDNSSTGGGIIGVDFIANSVHELDSSCYLVFRSNSYLYNLFYSNEYQRGYGVGYDEGYDEGYDLGYERGEGYGYNNGVLDVLNPDSTQYQYIYDLGKQEGIVEGMRGTESNAFIVIGQAFSAVGSIFSIEVMPNLPLWVLVFTPLIIVVVIVVVKLIKG